MQNINVNLPANIAEYVSNKSKDEYLSKAAVVRQYLINAILEERVLECRKKGCSISKTAELNNVSVPKVLEVLAKFGSEEIADIEEDYAMLKAYSKTH